MAKQSPANSLTELQVSVLRQFRLIYGSIKQHFREVEAACGISGSQVWILHDIAVSPGTGVSRLAERLSIHQSTCSQLVDKLVVAGLVSKQRSVRDHRKVDLEITAAGKKLLARVPGPAEGLLPEALRELPDDALASLRENLGHLIANLKGHNETDAEKPLADL